MVRKTRRKQTIFIILNLLILGILLLSGCEDTPKKKEESENKIFIYNGDDDGYIAVLRTSLPVPFGYISSENDQPLRVGQYTSSTVANGSKMISRGIFRFNISEWDGTDIKCYVKCIQKHGTPSDVHVYIINDSQGLSDFQDLRDLSDIWYRMDYSNAEKIKTTPKKGKWMVVTFSKNIISTLARENNYIAIIVQLSNENNTSNNDYYEFATIDYTPLDTTDQPYLAYSKD